MYKEPIINLKVNGNRGLSETIYRGILIPELVIKKVVKDAILPKYGSDGAIGLDLFAAEDKTIPPGERRLISTGVSMAIPTGFYGRIAPRSSWATKGNVDIGAGVVDPDYRGTVFVCLINNGARDLVVAKGDKCAQMIFEVAARVEKIKEVDGELDTTGRGTGGFGSTGIGGNFA